MQPFALTVEGTQDELSDELAGALANVFADDTGDTDAADAAHQLAGYAVELAGSAAFGSGVDRYTVSINGGQHGSAGDHDGLDTLSVVINAAQRSPAPPRDSDTAGQV